MLEFTKYLKEHYNEDTSSAEKIIQEKWDKVVAIIKEAFDDEYADKKTALYKIKNDFINESIAPKSIDVDFLKKNMDYVVSKINSLNEGEIKIVIHNDIDKGRGSSVSVPAIGGGSDIEMESANSDTKKKGRGRPKKNVVEEEAEAEEEKKVKVSFDGTNVIVEPTEGTGLEKSEHEFESEEEAKEFADSLKNLFSGFEVEVEEKEEAEGEEPEDAEEEVYSMESKKTKKKAIKEEAEGEEPEDVGEEPEDAGEEPEDAGEEPEDAGEEPEDAGEEPEDAGEEPEDADAISWEDIADLGGEEDAEEEMSRMSYDIESLDLKKLVGNLVKVEDKWYNVASITEDKQIVAVDKDGEQSKFSFEDLEEMECDLDEMCGKDRGEEEMEDAEEEMDYPDHEEKDMGAEEEMEDDGGLEDVMVKVRDGEDLSEPERDIIAGAIAAAKEGKSETDTVLDNVMDKLHSGERLSDEEIDVLHSAISVATDEEAEEELEVDLGAEEELEEEGLSFAKLANRYLDEELYDPSSVKGGGLTSNTNFKVGKAEPTNTPDKGVGQSKPTPTGNYTSKVQKVKEPLEPAGTIPKSDKKKAPTGSYTKASKKPQEKLEKVPAPNIPSEYKNGGGPKIKEEEK